MWPGGTKLLLQDGQPVHARQAYGNDPVIDTFIYLQRLTCLHSTPIMRLIEDPQESRTNLQSVRAYYHGQHTQ
jgi:hypothetical protein